MYSIAKEVFIGSIRGESAPQQPQGMPVETKTFERPKRSSCGAMCGPLPYAKKVWMAAPEPAAANHSAKSSPPMRNAGIDPPPESGYDGTLEEDGAAAGRARTSRMRTHKAANRSNRARFRRHVERLEARGAPAISTPWSGAVSRSVSIGVLDGARRSKAPRTTSGGGRRRVVAPSVVASRRARSSHEPRRRRAARPRRNLPQPY